ncbi:MAG: hypothetical protein B7X41_20265 [Microbacterium sp. 14-71-5]|jgi:hypothetical protein|uniref:hypothetical protein n=1 Tax=Microbacterium sp. 13-71-7 TaxID=1970399 RepID=UPI000BD44F4D|nr:hypothetical protein [Microbacterium sp. 13-71-7]OZB78171.1 MAG: hypothetical protein B7X41_20265 [Microbacterium sp. 14-71-5]OZB85382.1 MAG: hypothetical protein B7X32_03560 [Microbacterium sp. 13-71-7]
MTSANGGAEASRDYYPLTYWDPTGETAVRNLMGRSVQVTWENGATIHLDIETIRPLLRVLDYQMSRKGHIWGHKKKSPAATGDQNQNPTITKEN